ncbi:MAG: hypothetical protein HOW97_17070 [Catenulispora sp.]|nr:hypothetical protein [Catenulispora sp.]
MTNCTICRRPTDDRNPIRHQRCAERLRADLADIPGHYALMGAVLAPGTAGGGAHVSGTRTAPLPVRLEPLSLRARGGMVTVLALWEADWRELRELTPAMRGTSATDLAAIVLSLRAHLPWAIENHGAVDEFAREVRDLLHQCRAAAGLLPSMMRIGDCPAQDDDQPCGAALYADPMADVIRCRKCRTTWPRGQWMLLGKTLREVEDERISA